MPSKMDIDEKLNSSLDSLVKQGGDRPSRGGGFGRGRGRGEKRERNDTGELNRRQKNCLAGYYVCAPWPLGLILSDIN